DGHSHLPPIHIKWHNASARLEITVLIENIISRQERLIRFTDRLGALEQSSSVMKRFTASLITIDKPDQQCGISDVRVKFLQESKISGTNRDLKTKSCGGYPVSASSGVSTNSAPAAASPS